jgi:hypothetical protein
MLPAFVAACVTFEKRMTPGNAAAAAASRRN